MIDQNLLFSWLGHIGYIGLFVIVFMESGVFFGFVLPGDSLVFAAGVLAAKGILSLYILVPILLISAILGFIFGYWFGDKLGHWLINKEDSMFYRRKHLDLARTFYTKHGGKALVIGRVVPIVRTFVPIVAGMAAMPYRRFMFFNVLGAFFWTALFICLGYFLGILIPSLIDYMLPIAGAIILASIAPGIWHVVKKRIVKNRKNK